jgi:hypothetical protein
MFDTPKPTMTAKCAFPSESPTAGRPTFSTGKIALNVPQASEARQRRGRDLQAPATVSFERVETASLGMPCYVLGKLLAALYRVRRESGASIDVRGHRAHARRELRGSRSFAQYGRGSTSGVPRSGRRSQSRRCRAVQWEPVEILRRRKRAPRGAIGSQEDGGKREPLRPEDV